MLSGPSPNTVVAYVRCRLASWYSREPDRVQAVIIRPGDPLRKSVRCPRNAATVGDETVFEQIAEPDGARRGIERATARIADGVASTPTDPGSFRASYRFRPLGAVAYTATGAAMQVSDEGGPARWSTAPFHGRVQSSNGETGYYGRLADGAIGREGDAITLATRRLPTPRTGEDGRRYPTSPPCCPPMPCPKPRSVMAPSNGSHGCPTGAAAGPLCGCCRAPRAGRLRSTSMKASAKTPNGPSHATF